MQQKFFSSLCTFALHEKNLVVKWKNLKFFLILLTITFVPICISKNFLKFWNFSAKFLNYLKGPSTDYFKIECNYLFEVHIDSGNWKSSRSLKFGLAHTIRMNCVLITLMTTMADPWGLPSQKFPPKIRLNEMAIAILNQGLPLSHSLKKLTPDSWVILQQRIGNSYSIPYLSESGIVMECLKIASHF